MIIYKTTNLINGKIYIGKDSNNNEHYIGSGTKLLKAIEKYGRSSFKKEILETCISEQELADREKYWISYYNSLNSTIGYNIAEGGFGGNTRKAYTDLEKAEYVKKNQKARLKSLKVKAAYEAKKGIARPNHSKIMKELYASGQFIPHNLGKLTPEEVRQKISKANKGRKLTTEQRNNIAKAKYKPVKQFTLDGTYLETYPSIKHASEVCKIGRDSIYGCCIGKYKQGGGYVWEYQTIY